MQARIYRELHLHSASVQFLSGQHFFTEFACPAVNFDRMMKNKLMWILHFKKNQIRYLELFMEQIKCDLFVKTQIKFFFFYIYYITFST